MTRDHAKKILTHLRNGKSDLMLMDALDMAISALSEPTPVENTTVDELKNILNWGHCYCDSEGLPAYKAIKNAIAIITSLERLKAEIKCNTEHCECVPAGSCISVDKVLEIIDKHIGG